MGQRLKAVNRAIAKYGFELYRGRSYWYFFPLDVSTSELSDSMVVGVGRIESLSVEDWEAELVTKLEREGRLPAPPPEPIQSENNLSS